MSDRIRIDMDRQLFFELLQLCRETDEPILAQLGDLLDDKLDRMVRHELYSNSKTAASPEEREAARQAYLDRAGIPQGYRWGPEGPQ